jgi:hypothetical protein
LQNTVSELKILLGKFNTRIDTENRINELENTSIENNILTHREKSK